tara:strand:+ start:102 stop:1100 length:999 start_codon:yes stop_codon:yes gene_type:complete
LKKNIKCPICNNCEFKQLSRLFDDRYGEPNIYSISKCTSCNHLITIPRIKNKDLSSLYGNFYPRKDLSPDRILQEAKAENSKFSKIIRWLKGTNNQGQFFIRKNQFMLDIGCGSGVSLIEASNLGATAFGVEADPNIKYLAEKLKLNIFIGDFDKDTYFGKNFDLIVMNQVIEHIPEPSDFLKIIKGKMTRESILVVSFPNTKSFWRYISGNKWINWHVPYHLHHFNAFNFERMSKNCGFKIINKKTITPNIWTILQIRTFFNTYKKGEKNKLWNKVYLNKKNIKNKTKILFNFRIIIKFICQLLITFINRIIDVIGKGDSLIFFLKLEKEQ